MTRALRRLLTRRGWSFLFSAASLAVPCVRPGDAPRHFIYFGAARARIEEPSFLAHPTLAGAQLRFTWRELEPERDRYEFGELRARLELLERHGKRLWIQVQDASFGETDLTPAYLRADSSFHGGSARKYEGEGEAARFDGWVARRWDPAVRTRYLRLLQALAREFDGRLEGVNLPETAVSFDHPSHRPVDFTDSAYAAAIRTVAADARAAFTRSCVVLYANFMPGEWLPGNDRGYLRTLYADAARVGFGVGGPDILPHRRGQQNHSLALVAARPAGVIAAMAVQDGNLREIDPATGQPVTAADLLAFARGRLRLDYVFWGTEEPFYTRDVLPLLRTLPSATPERPRD